MVNRSNYKPKAALLLSLVLPSCTASYASSPNAQATVPERFYIVVREGAMPTLNKWAPVLERELQELVAVLSSEDSKIAAEATDKFGHYLAQFLRKLDSANSEELDADNLARRIELAERAKTAGAIYRLASKDSRSGASPVDPISDLSVRLELLNLEARTSGISARFAISEGDSLKALSGCKLGYPAELKESSEANLNRYLRAVNTRAATIFGAQNWRPATLRWVSE